MTPWKLGAGLYLAVVVLVAAGDRSGMLALPATLPSSLLALIIVDKLGDFRPGQAAGVSGDSLFRLMLVLSGLANLGAAYLLVRRHRRRSNKATTSGHQGSANDDHKSSDRK